MTRAYHRPSLALVLVAAACGPTQTRGEEPARLEADCATLIEAATRAEGCDPTLQRLAAQLRAAPDELACRRQARRLLDPAPSDARVHGVYEGSADPPPPPLSLEERARLLALPLPGILRIEPDLRPAPGVPLTSVRMGEHALSPHGDGSFLVHTSPGEHTLQLSYVGEQREFCVRLEACEPVDLVTHGAQLARHERLSPGACGQPGLEVAAGDG